MIRLKEKATPEAVDALTVSEELRRGGRAREGGRRGLPPLAADGRARGRRGARLRAHRQGALAPAQRARGHARDPGRRGLAQRRGPRADRARRGRAVQDRPRRRHVGDALARGDPARRDRQARGALEERRRAHRHAVRLHGPRRAHRRLPARQPDRARGAALDGKSAAATNIAEYAAVEAGVPVALFSLEMSETELAHRFLASQARVSSDDLRKGRVRAEKWPKVLQAVEKLARAPIFVDDSSDMSVLELRAKSRRLAARHGLGLVVVDYLQLMRPEGRAREQPRRADRPDQPRAQDPRPRAERAGDRASRSSRARWSRATRRCRCSPTSASRARSSRTPTSSCSSTATSTTTRSPSGSGEADFIIAKHRNGPIGDVALTFLPKYPKFANLYRERGAEPMPAGRATSAVSGLHSLSPCQE